MRLDRLRRAMVLLAAVLVAACDDGTAVPQDGAAPSLNEPALETDAATLEAAFACTPFEHPDQPPVLLVHGTFTNGWEQYDWTYLPLLAERGFDVCAVSYPDRGLGDMQVSAEYVVHAIRRIHAQTGRKLALIGHSQGVAVPRWALKWWPSARAAVDDFVMLAGPNHGTQIADPVGVLGLPIPTSGGQMPAVFWQFRPDSQFMAASNRDDETPGEIDYTALYTAFDELVQPVTPVPTAAVDFGLDNPKVANILLQDVCAGRFVDHLTIGLSDRLSFELALDAIRNPGPANLERAGGAALCGLAPIVPDQQVYPGAVEAFIAILQREPDNGLPDWHLAESEPALKPYAQ